MFRVRWEETALNELTALWMQASSAMRQVITAATNRIDHQLQTDPLGPSESRPGGGEFSLLLRWVSPFVSMGKPCPSFVFGCSGDAVPNRMFVFLEFPPAQRSAYLRIADEFFAI